MILAPELRPDGKTATTLLLRQQGMSLLEVAMLMLIMILALAPTVKMIGGPNSANGNTMRVIGTQAKEVLMANSLIEQVMAGNFTSLGANNTAANLPQTGGTGYIYPRFSTTQFSTSPLYYQWTIMNRDTASTPSGNHYYTAVLNVYNSSSSSTPLLSMPTSFFYNSNGANNPQNKTGIIIVQDISGSMVWAKDDYSLLNANGMATPSGPGASVASPYLRYRYADPSVGYNPVHPLAYAGGGNAFNDQLDIVSAEQNDDPTTPWDDRYIGVGIHGIPDCNSNANWNGAAWRGSQYYSSEIDSLPANQFDLYQGMFQWYQPQPIIKSTLQNICGRSPDWNTMMNNNMSRIEAARSSLLNFLVSTEADSMLYQNTKLGFITFSSPNNATHNDPSGLGWDVRVSLESVDNNNRYPNMRRQLSWMNRQGPGQINAYNGTNYTAALQEAERQLVADPSLNNRIILFVSDGAPNGPGDNHPQLSALSTAIGNGSYPGANGKTTTMFTLGLLNGDPNMQTYLQNDMAQNTPNGQYFYAQNVGDVSPIFDQIKYQIQKTILLSQSNRYNIDLN